MAQYRIEIDQCIETHGTVNYQDPNNNLRTLFHKYCMRSRDIPISIFEYLFEKGANINLQDKDGVSPLQYGVQYLLNPIDPTVLSSLLNRQELHIDQKDLKGRTLLHYACKNINHVPIAVFNSILDRGADINLVDVCQNNPLQLAFKHYSTEAADGNNPDINTIIKKLLDLPKLQTNHQNKCGKTIVHIALENQNPGKIPLILFQQIFNKGGNVMIKDQLDNTSIHLLFKNYSQPAQSEVIQLFLDQPNVNINEPNNKSCTPFHYACHYVATIPMVIQYLVDTMNADVTARDYQGHTPLQIACENYRRSSPSALLIRLINRPNVNVNQQDSAGFSILHSACKNLLNIQVDVFQLLVGEKGGDLNLPASGTLPHPQLDTPLHLAVTASTLRCNAVVRYLLSQNGININAVGFRNRTVFHNLCSNISSYHYDTLFDLITNCRPDCAARDNSNTTPVQYAMNSVNVHGEFETEQRRLIPLLLQQDGVDVNYRSNVYGSLLDLASANIDNIQIDIFRDMIENKNGDLTIQSRSDRQNVVQIAFRNPKCGNYLPTLEYLLHRLPQDSIDDGDVYARTLFHLSCENYQNLPLSLFQAIVETKGADVFTRGYPGPKLYDSPFHAVLMNGRFTRNIEVLRYVLKLYGVSAQILGAEDDNLEIQRYIEMKGLIFNNLDNFSAYLRQNGLVFDEDKFKRWYEVVTA